MISDQEQRNVWLSFATAAVSGGSTRAKMTFEDIIEDAVEIADEMLEEYRAKFDTSHPDYVAPGTFPSSPAEEEDEDEDHPPPKRRSTGRKHRRGR